MTPEDKLEIIKKHIAQLSEHFDTVQIFCSQMGEEEVGNTESFSSG